jgi:hypothetical protein
MVVKHAAHPPTAAWLATHNTAAASFKLNRDCYGDLSLGGVPQGPAGAGPTQLSRRIRRMDSLLAP